MKKPDCKSESVIKSCKTCSKDEILEIIGVEVKKSEIRQKSGNLHPSQQQMVKFIDLYYQIYLSSLDLFKFFRFIMDNSSI